jgi:hypothetical protein
MPLLSLERQYRVGNIVNNITAQHYRQMKLVLKLFHQRLVFFLGLYGSVLRLAGRLAWKSPPAGCRRKQQMGQQA